MRFNGRRGRPGSGPLLLLAGVLALAGCADRGGDDGGLVITALHPWVRAPLAPEGETAGGVLPTSTAAYLVIQNPTAHADELIGVETPLAETVELHSATMDGDVMRMRRVRSVPIPAAGEAALEPGGYHIMLIGLYGTLDEGDAVPLILQLRSGQTLEVLAPVRESSPRL
jgi:copper(I)-binding protein